MSDEEELDLDTAMADQMAEIKERDDNEDEPETEASSDDSGEPEEESGEDESSGESENSAEESEESGSEEDSSEDNSEEDSQEEIEDKAPPAPVAYSAAAKDDWDKTPKSVQDAAIKREIDSTKGLEMLKETSSFGTSLSNAASPYMAMIQSKGATLESFIVGQGNTMYGLEHGTPDQKVGIIRGMAQMAGIDLANIQPPSEIEKQLSPYMQEIQTLKNQINQQNQTTTSQNDLAINQAISVFEAEVDEKGTLLHPYFRNVESEMITNMPLIRQQNPHFSHAEVLKQAYDNSIWANPETRDQLQAQQSRAVETERKRKAKVALGKAKKADKVNLRKKGQPVTSQAETLGDNVDDIMAETLKDIKSR